MKLLKVSFILSISIFSISGIIGQNVEITCPPNMVVPADNGKEGAVTPPIPHPPVLSSALVRTVLL
jgi:hypothetical protein